MEKIREIISHIAKCANGLRADSQDYLDFIAYDEDYPRQVAMSKMSGCALTVTGIWHSAGLYDPDLDPPYKYGQAISRIIKLANKYKAWNLFSSGLYPDIGDAVLIGNNTTDGGYEHVYTIHNIVSEGVFDTIDGGQIDKGLQCIKEKHHKWSGNRDIGYSNIDPGSNTSGGRVIIGWVDIVKLPFITIT